MQGTVLDCCHVVRINCQGVFTLVDAKVFILLEAMLLRRLAVDAKQSHGDKQIKVLPPSVQSYLLEAEHSLSEISSSHFRPARSRTDVDH